MFTSSFQWHGGLAEIPRITRWTAVDDLNHNAISNAANGQSGVAASIGDSVAETTITPRARWR